MTHFLCSLAQFVLLLISNNWIRREGIIYTTKTKICFLFAVNSSNNYYIILFIVIIFPSYYWKSVLWKSTSAVFFQEKYILISIFCLHRQEIIYFQCPSMKRNLSQMSFFTLTLKVTKLFSVD